MRTYVIGDIHGCNRTFQALLERLSLRIGDAVVLLGDLIDRGPDSKGVIDTVWRLQTDKKNTAVCLRGNHEQMLLDALEDPLRLDDWLFNGGRQTLNSFELDRPEEIPRPYLRFIYAMPLWYETKGYLCVHGGPDFSAPDPLAYPEKLLWMRRWYDNIDYNWLGGRIILHGHTPETLAQIRLQHQSMLQTQYLNLDNGCVYARPATLRGELGHLLAISLDTGELIAQECLD